MPVAPYQTITKIPFGQPLLFNNALVGDIPENDWHYQQQINDCRNYDDRIYLPFYVRQIDSISVQFEALNKGFQDTEDTCIGNFTYAIKIVSDSGGTDSSLFSPEIIKEIDAANDISHYSFFFGVPSNSDPDSCYHLEIYLTGTPPFCANPTIVFPVLLATSQQFKLYNNIPECSIQLRWYNDNEDETFGFIYNDGSDHAEQETRLTALQWKPKYNEDVNSFKDSKGKRFILAAQSEPDYLLLIDEVPEYIHNALRLAKLNDVFKIDGVQYDVISKDYNPEWRNDSKFAQITLEITKANGESIRSNC